MTERDGKPTPARKALEMRIRNAIVETVATTDIDPMEVLTTVLVITARLIAEIRDDGDREKITAMVTAMLPDSIRTLRGDVTAFSETAGAMQ